MEQAYQQVIPLKQLTLQLLFHLFINIRLLDLMTLGQVVVLRQTKFHFLKRLLALLLWLDFLQMFHLLNKMLTLLELQLLMKSQVK